MQQTHVYEFVSRGTQRAQSAWRVAATQPGWVTRSAAMAFLAVIFVPIALLILAAVLAAVALFALLAVANWIAVRVRGLLGVRSDGRSENIRVIRRPR